MKAVKFIEMILLSLFMILNFASCGKEDIDDSKLEGEWLFKSDVGYILDKNTNEKVDDWNEGIGENPEKAIVKKVKDNVYSIQSYIKINGNWKADGGISQFRLEGNKIIFEGSEDDVRTITTLTSDKLVIVSESEDDEYKYYEEVTYTR